MNCTISGEVSINACNNASSRVARFQSGVDFPATNALKTDIREI